MVTLVGRSGADRFPFEAPGFATAPFQRELVATAERHALLGLVLVELERSGHIETLQSVSGIDGAGHLRRLRRQAAMWDLERDAVLRRLSRAAIPALLLKGAALRLTAYRDSAERGFADIDLLVRPESLQDAVAALARDGYQLDSEAQVKVYLEHHHHLILTKPGGFLVEVHWALEPERSAIGLDPSAFWRDARAVPAPGVVSALVPGLEHMVLHLAQQSVEDGLSQFRRVVDVDRVIATATHFDWEHLAVEARRMRMQAGLAVTIRLAEQLLGAAVPEGFVAGLGLPAAVRRHLDLLDPVALVLLGDEPDAARELFHLWCMPDLSARLRTLKDMVSGERDRLMNVLLPRELRKSATRRMAALAKLAAYQAYLYPAALFRRRRRPTALVWARGRSGTDPGSASGRTPL
jgi:hypothetical protein